MTSTLPRNLLATAIALSLGSALPVHPVQAQANRGGSAVNIIEEVTITARKRSLAESAQEVPLSITAYGPKKLEAMYVKDLTDLSFAMPSVQMDQVGTFPGVQNFTIRGQGINSSIPSVDPTVGIFIDGVFMGTSFGAVIDMFDLEKIEVLRGPQGLLFGRNVTGGAVNIRTARPSGEFGGKVRGRVSTGVESNVAATVEGSLSERLAGKVTGYYTDDRGYWDNKTNTQQTDPFWGLAVPPEARSNPADGGKAGERETYFGRGTLVWQVGDDSDITLIGESGKMDGDGAVWTTREGIEGGGPFSGQLDSDETTQDENGVTDITWNAVTLEANVTFSSGAVITNILGYRDLETYARSDIDGLSTPLFNAPGSTDQDQLSNELRFAFTSPDQSWNYTTGLYYFEQDITYIENRWAGLRIINPDAPPVVFNSLNLGGDMDHKTYAVFATGDYHLSDSVKLTAGLRYTHEEKDARIVNADPNVGGGACPDQTLSSCNFVQLSDTWENLTPQLGADWQVGDNVMLYALYTKGFRSGGVNFRNSLPSIIDPGPTREEEQDAFELGLKSDFADGRVRLNAALYHVQVKDMQRELNVSFANLGVSPLLRGLIANSGTFVWQATVNAGDVDITGAELDLTALVTENFALTASTGYVDSEYKSLTPEILAAEARAGTRLIGSDLPRLSPWTASLGANYDIHLNDSGVVTLRASYSYRDPAPYNDDNSQILRSVRMVNASAQWASADERWIASVFGKNLNDEVQWGSLNGLLETSGGATKGRVYGAELTYAF